MDENTTTDVASEFDQAEPDPAALSLVGGTFGTLVGLKRGGVPGAIAGGFVGGTTGYLVGAVSQEGARPHEDVERDVNPITIETDEQSDDESGSRSDAGADESEDSDNSQGTDNDDET